MILSTLKVNVTKAKIRKSPTKLHFEKSAIFTFNLYYSLNRKSETHDFWIYIYGLKHGTFTHYVIIFGINFSLPFPVWV